MKKYHSIIVLSILLYVFLAVGGYFWLIHAQHKTMQGYKVEINRLYQKICEEGMITEFHADTYEFIEDVQYLSKDASSKETQTFFEEENNRQQSIRIWYENEQLIGYIKFLYQQPQFHNHQLFWILEGSLFLLELGILWILFYLKRKLIQPFMRLNSLPQELAKGHFKKDVIEEKTRYLGQFLWGMGQLKDSLEASRKRQLELEKEKKQMLLSLSHDIKTPLSLIKLYSKAIAEHVYEDEEGNLQAARQMQEKVKEIEQYVDAIMKSSREDILDIQVDMDEFYLHEFIQTIRLTFEEVCAIRKLELIIGSYDDRLLKGDLHRLQEVFENLFDNAFKYGDGNRIEITCYEEDYCQLIRFYNTGMEINDNDINHMFESFFRGANSKGKQGSGLGLYICREIMRKMDGEIFAQKEQGGISFIVVIR